MESLLCFHFSFTIYNFILDEERRKVGNGTFETDTAKLEGQHAQWRIYRRNVKKVAGIFNINILDFLICIHVSFSHLSFTRFSY
jgi:hypothetical protein